MEQIKILIDADVFQRLEEKIDGLTEELANRDKLMTAEEAAEFLNVSSAQVVYRLARDGELPFIKLGKLKRFSKLDIMKMRKAE